MNIIAVLAFIASATAQYFSPGTFIYLSYLGMFFLPLFIINLCFVIFWIINFKWHFLLSLSVIFLFWGSINISLSLFERKGSSTNEEKIKVLTYNVMIFNYYDKNTKILDYITESEADILCLQEFGWHKNEKEFLSKNEIFAKLKNYPYYHIDIQIDGNKAIYGIATFSKFPILNKQKIKLEGKFASSIYSDIKIGNDTLRVFNNHLESNKFTKHDKDDMSENINSDVIANAAQKLGAATVIRAKQTEAVAKEIKKSPYKVLVCGDFNDVPISYTYKQISRGLKDTFVKSGEGIGSTYHDLFYRFRIDYILTDKTMGYSGFSIGKVKYSDHYPVFCNVNF